MKAFRNLRLMGIALALPTLIGFHFMEGWPWFDGFCIGITGFTTIGYQEVHPPSHSGGVFKVALIRAGGSLMWLSIGLLTQALLEFELRSFFGGRKMERPIEPGDYRIARGEPCPLRQLEPMASRP